MAIHSQGDLISDKHPLTVIPTHITGQIQRDTQQEAKKLDMKQNRARQIERDIQQESKKLDMKQNRAGQIERDIQQESKKLDMKQNRARQIERDIQQHARKLDMKQNRAGGGHPTQARKLDLKLSCLLHR